MFLNRKSIFLLWQIMLSVRKSYSSACLAGWYISGINLKAAAFKQQAS